MPDGDVDSLQAELSRARDERDAARRELDDLRAWLCKELGIVRRTPGPAGLLVLSAASDREIVAAVVKLRTEVDALRQPSDTAEARWSQIDYLISEGRRVQALQKIRDEFGGSIHDALELLDLRFLRLREDRPDDFADGHQSPERG